MIRQLTGTVAAHDISSLVIDVGGVGYLVHTSKPGIHFTLNSRLTLHTYLAVRENALDLYGFERLEELEIFELLISLPKIGPKSAVQILAQADIALLREAVAQNDPTYLSKMSGIGKKSAEKIVAGLKDVLGSEESLENTTSQNDIDVIDALIALGYNPHDARKALQTLPHTSENTNERIKAALKILSV